MRVLVTGSAGHLGEALVRSLRDAQHEVIGLDMLPSPYTTDIGSIVDRACVRRCMDGVQAVFHAATLHKPHVATHRRQDFVDTNITGTLNLLEEAAAGVASFVFTSTTSVFGDALVPPPGAPAAWVTEEVRPMPRNIYGSPRRWQRIFASSSTGTTGLACIVLRTSRFFPEEDDNKVTRDTYADDNAKANEFLFRRLDLEDAVGRASVGRQARARRRFSLLHHQRDDAVPPRGPARAAHRCTGRGAAAGSGLSGRVQAPRLADVSNSPWQMVQAAMAVIEDRAFDWQ
jgi:UDP-glucose 4-epimerase